MPDVARKRIEFTPPVRLPPERAARHHRPHPRRHIENMRLPGGKQDWLSKLNALDQ